MIEAIGVLSPFAHVCFVVSGVVLGRHCRACHRREDETRHEQANKLEVCHAFFLFCGSQRRCDFHIQRGPRKPLLKATFPHIRSPTREAPLPTHRMNIDLLRQDRCLQQRHRHPRATASQHASIGKFSF
jgi:hypothetical protein